MILDGEIKIHLSVIMCRDSIQQNEKFMMTFIFYSPKLKEWFSKLLRWDAYGSIYAVDNWRGFW